MNIFLDFFTFTYIKAEQIEPNWNLQSFWSWEVFNIWDIFCSLVIVINLFVSCIFYLEWLKISLERLVAEPAIMMFVKYLKLDVYRMYWNVRHITHAHSVHIHLCDSSVYQIPHKIHLLKRFQKLSFSVIRWMSLTHSPTYGRLAFTAISCSGALTLQHSYYLI